MDMNGGEIAYVLTNPAMPGLVKIGHTSQQDLASRMSQLYTTGVPLPFDCVYAIEVPDAARVEKALHAAFGPTRVNPKREFFRIDVDQAIAVLEILDGKVVTPEVNLDLNTNVSPAEREAAKVARRPNMNFIEMGIPIGAELLYKDGESTVTVVSERKVRFEEEEMSLTAVTRRMMGTDYSIQPGPHWTYRGRTLHEYYNDTYTNVDHGWCDERAGIGMPRAGRFATAMESTSDASHSGRIAWNRISWLRLRIRSAPAQLPQFVRCLGTETTAERSRWWVTVGFFGEWRQR